MVRGCMDMLLDFRAPGIQPWLCIFLFSVTVTFGKTNAPTENPLLMPPVGWNELRIVSPTVLELTLITTKQPDPAPVEQWDFVHGEGRLQPPKPGEFEVRADNKGMTVSKVGFKRRVLYAPLKQR